MMGATIEVLEFSEWRNLASKLLLERAKLSDGGWAYFFLARIGDDEAGLLVLDLLDRPPCAFIREIFVVPIYRRNRVGATLLAHAEMVARRNHLPMLRLEAYPLDDGTSREFLTRWYLRNGFSVEHGRADRMAKAL
ncbi:GNAT family N-acetyltransferase [Burkholderia sp. Ax-1724]|uniref:GNAT family N-acetyltransferase n=1 Tax=Burkholderia sp. Ax-1724 TaxID=2608336 RepID=UPI00141F93FA|nr:GNAT family N-acetyltransferase [Burkholderia sp. Ax-1724]NIF54824.1 GNAT family N-acetyltransferase [Burkholderia sp. Ax-1724]